MPSFWDEIKTVNGDNTLGVIRMTGKLNSEKETGTNDIGEIWINAGERVSGSEAGYDLNPVGNNAENSIHTKQVYWLPWKNRSVEKVLMADLNRSGCEYFLTSMLSGCRFVVTEYYIAHVSNEQGTADAPTTSREGRDNAERPILAPNRPTNDHGYSESRRKLSISPVPLANAENRGMEATYGQDVIASYQRGNKAGVGTALALGYKEGDNWTFKWLKFSNGANLPLGTWAILE